MVGADQNNTTGVSILTTIMILSSVLVLSAAPAAALHTANQTEYELEIKQHLLEQINIYRNTSNLGNVTFGSNTAAQAHADEMLRYCYASVWGRDGLPIDFRYVLAGGNNFGGGVVDSTYYVTEYPCEADIRRHNTTQLVRDLFDPSDWAVDTRNIIHDYNNVRVNIGIAQDDGLVSMVLVFEKDLVDWMVEPYISNGKLRMTGNYTNEDIGSRDPNLGFTLYYDRLPQNLTVNQLTHAYCSDTGVGAAVLVTRADFGKYVYTIEEPECDHPYDLSPTTNRITPYQLWQLQNPGCYFLPGNDQPTCLPQPIPLVEPPCFFDCPPPTGNTPEVLMDRYAVKSGVFAVTSDISEILDEHGPGVYTLAISGVAKTRSYLTEEAILGYYSIFYQVPPSILRAANTE